MLIDEQGVAGAASGGGLWCVRTDDDSPPVHVGSGLARSLSPDGRWAAAADRNGKILLLPTGADTAQTIDLSPLQLDSHITWYPDGRSLMVMAHEEGRPVRMYRVDRAGGAPTPLTPEGAAFPTGAMPKPMSADGKQFFVIAGDGDLHSTIPPPSSRPRISRSRWTNRPSAGTPTPRRSTCHAVATCRFGPRVSTSGPAVANRTSWSRRSTRPGFSVGARSRSARTAGPTPRRSCAS